MNSSELKDGTRFSRVLVRFVSSVAIIVAATAALPSESDFLKARPEVVNRWQANRFGLFIHWGPVSIKGTEIGWSRGGERRGRHDSSKGSIPAEVYDNLYKEFNPIRFNTQEWVAIAKAAGMRYLVFTSKHHDGFCMFDSRLTDHKITNPDCPFGRDVVAELTKACHEGGIGLGFYYSPVDWYDKNYRTENHQKYIEYMHGQIRELCTKYGKVDVLWFDSLQALQMPGEPGDRNPPENAKVWDSVTLFKMIRQLQPDVIINNRCGLDGDFATPEQHVGRFQNDRPWESCITLGRQWAWKPEDQIKSREECIRILVQTVTGDGNLLLNVGPMPTGEIESRQVERLKEVGSWLKTYGESIYETRGGPFPNGEWGGSTFKGNKVYVHVLRWPEGSLQLPALKQKIVRSKVLSGGEVKVIQNEKGVTIEMPAAGRNPLDTVIQLELGEALPLPKPI